MDRKSWLIVIACIIGIGFNVWWMIMHPAPPSPPQTAPPPPPPPATAPGTPAPTTAATPPTSQAGAPAPAPLPPAGIPEQKVALSNGEVAYTFTTKGGGIATAALLTTKDHV